MSYVPWLEDWNARYPPNGIGTDRAITVYALKENKRPVGFAPWPDKPKKRKRKKAA